MRPNHFTLAIVAALTLWGYSSAHAGEAPGKTPTKVRPTRGASGRGCLAKYHTGHDKLPLAAPDVTITVWDGRKYTPRPQPVFRPQTQRVVRWIGRGRDPVKVRFEKGAQPDAEYSIFAQVRSDKLKLPAAMSCEVLQKNSEKGLKWREVAFVGDNEADRTPFKLRPGVAHAEEARAVVEKDIDVVNQLLPNTRFKMTGKTRSADGERAIAELRGRTYGEANFDSQDKNHNTEQIENFHNHGKNVRSATPQTNVENILVTRPVRDRQTMGMGKRARKWAAGMERHFAQMTKQVDAWQKALDTNGKVKIRIAKGQPYYVIKQVADKDNPGCKTEVKEQKTLEKSRWVTFDLSNAQDADYARYNMNPAKVQQWVNQRIATLTGQRDALTRQFNYVEKKGAPRKVTVDSLRQYAEQRTAEGRVLRSLVFTASADIDASIAYRNARLAGENKPLASNTGRTDMSGYSMTEIGATRGDTIEGTVRFNQLDNGRVAGKGNKLFTQRGSEVKFSFEIPDHTKVKAPYTIGGIPAYRLEADQVRVEGPTEIGAPAE